MSKTFQRYIYPSFIFLGGTIGVGFLSLPYIAAKVGIGAFLLYMLVMSSVMILLNMAFAEVSLKTPDFKRFPGFIEKYFGRKTKFFTVILLLTASFGTLLVYLIAGGQFLATVFGNRFGGSVAAYTLIYFIIACLIVFFDSHIVSKVVVAILSFFTLSLIFIFLKGSWFLKLDNLQLVAPTFSSNWFLPYGPLLFSLWGLDFIPEIEEIIRKKKDGLKKIIIGSTIAVAIFYFIFSLFILGISGSATTQIALTGLENFFDGPLLAIALLAGAAAILGAFVSHLNLLKESLVYDLGIKKPQAFVMACFTPMVLFLIGFDSFIPILSFLGGIILSFFGIMILLMYKKIGGKKAIIYPLSLVFVFSMIYEIFYFIKLQ